MSNYPERPSFPRPKKPSKGRSKPSSEKTSGGKRKTWSSDGSNIINGRDFSPRSGMPWWKSPARTLARVTKLALLRG